MKNKKILMLPPASVNDRAKKQMFIPSRKVSFVEQCEKINDFLSRAEEWFVTDNSEIINHEQTFVIEIVGRLEDFKKICDETGMEWLAEYPVDDVEIDDLCYPEEKKSNVEGTLFISSSNLSALQSLKVQFDRFKEGLKTSSRFKNFFESITDFRRWGLTDRLNDSGFKDYYSDLEILDRNKLITIEIELWFSEDEQKRNQAIREIKQLVLYENGHFIGEYQHSEAGVLLAKIELPVQSLNKILADNEKYSGLFAETGNGVDSIKAFRACGSMFTLSTESKLIDISIPSKVLDKPVVALLDGHPFPNHELLKDRLIINDPLNFASEYEFNEQSHGTQMASIILHGDYNDNSETSNRFLYVHPIMQPDKDDWRRPRSEIVPKEYFFEDLLEQALIHIFDIKKFDSIKIINLSICDQNRRFSNSMSSTAKVIDFLAFKYNVLFCISAGNSYCEMFDSVTIENGKSFIQHIHNQRIERSIMSPSESINCLTIGAINADEIKKQMKDYPHLTDISPDEIIPAPYTSFGPGYKRSIKPELIIPGGKAYYRQDIHNNWIRYQESGLRCAFPPNSEAEVSRICLNQGTSHATALASRYCSIIHDTIDEINILNGHVIIPAVYYACLIKAMITHSAEQERVGEFIHNALLEKYQSKRVRKLEVTKMIGYGVPDINQVISCSDSRVTMVGYGTLFIDKANSFEIPVTNTMYENDCEIKVTVAWFSPTRVKNYRYRNISLNIKMDEDIKTKGLEVDHNQVKRGTVQHKLFEVRRSSLLGRDSFKITIDCLKDAYDLDIGINYGVAVTIRLKIETQVPDWIEYNLYEEISERIGIKTQVQV
jgi:hypothetical protein